MTPAPNAVRRLATPTLLLAAIFGAGGCGLLFGGNPDARNIQLRKEKQALNDRVAALEAKGDADRAMIAGLQDSRPTVPTLPADRLARLFTTRGLQFGKLTGGWDGDPRAPGAEGIAVYVAPVDEEGQPIKAAGAFAVEAFDLAAGEEALVGRWTFDVPAAKATWRGSLLSYNYVLQCPWKPGPPAHPELTLKVTFLDELTQATFSAQVVVTVELPPATRPATGPSAATARSGGPAR